MTERGGVGEGSKGGDDGIRMADSLLHSRNGHNVIPKQLCSSKN